MLTEEFLENFGISHGVGFVKDITKVRSAVMMVVSKCRATSAQAANRDGGCTVSTHMA